jgi:hypothetical protein
LDYYHFVSVMKKFAVVPMLITAALGLVHAGTAPTAQSLAIPRIMAGNNWETTVVLVNAGATPMGFQAVFLNVTGIPQSLAVRFDSGTTVTSGFSATLGANSTLTFVLPDTGQTATQQGWSLINYDGSQGKLGGYTVLRHKGLAGSSFEATVPLSSLQDYSAYMPFDNTHGFRTQVTILNPATNLGTQVVLTFYSPKGQLLFLDAINLQPGQQTTISLPDMYPDLANNMGAVTIVSGTDRLSVSGLRYNPSLGAIAAMPWVNQQSINQASVSQ